MRRIAVIAALAIGFATPAIGDHYLQAEPREYALEGATQIKVEFPVGRLTIEGDDGNTVRVLVRVDCRERDYEDCKRETRRIRIEHHVSEGRFALQFEGIRKELGSPRINVEARLLVPRKLVSRAEMGVGELRVSGMTSDIEAELGVGELTVKADARHYRDAEAESGVGHATIRAPGGDVRDRGFIGHTARWTDGHGPSFLRAHVGVGQVEVTLR